MSSLGSKPKVAVITGGHSYDVPNFHALFRAISDVDVYIQHLDDFASSPKQVQQSYDVVLYYIMMIDTPPAQGLPWYSGNPRQAIEDLGETPQGIIVLHHAILAYPHWPLWNELVGIADRRFGFHIGQTIRVNVADPGHPITSGLCSWEMTDETYTMASAGEDSRALLTVDCPKSMKTLAWARQYRNSRVLCWQSGHNNVTWQDANFREVLRRAILWCARRI